MPAPLQPSEIVFECLYGVSSPWAFLGAPEAERFAKRFGVVLRMKPILVIEENGGIPLRTRPQPRQDYHALDLSRWSTLLNANMKAKPTFYPVSNIRIPAQSIIRLQLLLSPSPHTLASLASSPEALGHDLVRAYSYAIQRALWVEQRDVGDLEVLKELARGVGIEEELIERFVVDRTREEGEEAVRGFEENLAYAQSLNVFGTPTYVVNGEIFWGQDRLTPFVEGRIEELLKGTQ